MYPLKIKEKYDRSNLANLEHRFSVPYLGNYKEGDMNEESGSHPGVDIRPETKNQDVLSVLPGKVFKVGEDGSYGKYVFIEHTNVPHPDDLSKTTTLFSCYEHLSEYNVKEGDILKEGDKIGKTGDTGITSGEHLHFQIDRNEAPYHAYWPYTGAEVKAAGVGFSEGVNLGLGKDKAKMYTVNPLVYLDKIAGSNIAPLAANENKVSEVKVASNTENKTPTTPINTTTNTTAPETPKVVVPETPKVTVPETTITQPTPTSPVVEKVITSDTNSGILNTPDLDSLISGDKKKI